MLDFIGDYECLLRADTQSGAVISGGGKGSRKPVSRSRDCETLEFWDRSGECDITMTVPGGTINDDAKVTR